MVSLIHAFQYLSSQPANSSSFLTYCKCDEQHVQFGGYPFLDTFFLRCDWTRPNQNKTRLAEGDWVQANGDKKMFLKRPYWNTKNIKIKSVCRQHLLINLSYNISTDISSLFSHSQRVLRILSNTIFAWIEGPTIRSVARIYAPPPACLFLANFWVDEGFIDKRGSPFTILF